MVEHPVDAIDILANIFKHKNRTRQIWNVRSTDGFHKQRHTHRNQPTGDSCRVRPRAYKTQLRAIWRWQNSNPTGVRKRTDGIEKALCGKRIQGYLTKAIPRCTHNPAKAHNPGLGEDTEVETGDVRVPYQRLWVPENACVIQKRQQLRTPVTTTRRNNRINIWVLKQAIQVAHTRIDIAGKIRKITMDGFRIWRDDNLVAARSQGICRDGNASRLARPGR